MEKNGSKKKEKKDSDFFLGLGIMIASIMVSFWVISFILSNFLSTFFYDSMTFVLWTSPVAGILFSIFIYNKFYSGRKYVKMGMISAIVILALLPLLVVGACAIMFSGF